ncbi:M20/M25/M40 family metallo-hydrolase, partial [Microbacteriaceae bacterium K1510]|nr:M20/M25/M40 family metallo-hydrolase [Frankia sp. Cpl3]MCK9910355.1 M20/M25/M40 family metallo-hydrolase [Microbacteriaceae bacterium K1510]
MNEIIDRLKREDRQFDARYELFFSRNPFEISPEEPIARSLRQSYQKRFAAEPIINGFSGWADSALTQDAGIPTILFGPRGVGLHAEVEYVEFDSVVDMTTILIDTILD